MTRLLINIRGCNGSGKSTIPLSMMNDPDLEVVEVLRGAKITVFPKYKWVTIGTYFNKTGGMDTISTKFQKHEALEYAWKNYPDYDIVMEGVIDSTIFSTYADLFIQYKNRVGVKDISPRKIIIMNFLPPLETCLERIYARNGGKPIKEDAVGNKWKSVWRNATKFKEAGFTSLKIDTSKIKKEDMLDKFLAICNKYRG